LDYSILRIKGFVNVGRMRQSAYHVDGDFSDFGGSMVFTEGFDPLLFLRDPVSENLLEIRGRISELPHEDRRRYFLKKKKKNYNYSC